MTDQLRAAAQAVLDRWDSPKWEWATQGPTADLMAELRAALAQQAELEQLRAENARLAREAHTWWTALAGATAEIEQWRRSAERCVTAWTVVRGGVWDPNGLMDEHMAALRKALGPNARHKRETPDE